MQPTSQIEKDVTVAFLRRRLAILNHQEAQVLALARQPGLSKKNLRHFCQALFHTLRSRQIVLAGLRDWSSDDA